MCRCPPPHPRFAFSSEPGAGAFALPRGGASGSGAPRLRLPHFVLCTSHFVPRTSYFVPRTSYFVPCTSYFALRTLYLVLCISYFVLLTSYLVLRTSYLVLCTMYFVPGVFLLSTRMWKLRYPFKTILCYTRLSSSSSINS